MTTLRLYLFHNELFNNEQILWMGQPEASGIFTSEDIFIIHFSLVWLLISFPITIEAFNTGELLFISFSLPFLLIGLYLLFRRIIYRLYLKKKTYYAVTNQRVLILTNLFSRNL